MPPAFGDVIGQVAGFVEAVDLAAEVAVEEDLHLQPAADVKDHDPVHPHPEVGVADGAVGDDGVKKRRFFASWPKSCELFFQKS